LFAKRNQGAENFKIKRETKMNKKLVQIIVLAVVLLAGSTLESYAQLCGCDNQRGSVIQGRVSDIYGLGAPNFKVVAINPVNFDELWTYTDVNGYYEFTGTKVTYPPYNQNLERCTGYNVHVESFYVTPYNINVYTNATDSSCQDPLNVNFMYNYWANAWKGDGGPKAAAKAPKATMIVFIVGERLLKPSEILSIRAIKGGIKGSITSRIAFPSG
jgi:hypothetical protein